MPGLSYNKQGIILKKGSSAASDRQVRDLQKDLRQLGYLKSGIDGVFGSGTERAVMAMQYDLLHNNGKSTRGDGNAPVSILGLNRGRVAQVNGAVDQKLAACVSDMLDEPTFPVLPRSDNPRQENSRIVSLIKETPSGKVPVPFLMAIFQQESGLKHYNEPAGKDEDTYITVGLDTNAGKKHIITSRGYGAGQYTLFHHPPRREEVEDFMLDVRKNILKGMNELREKFDTFVCGSTPGTKADDRTAEHGRVPLRFCQYPESDPRRMTDCKKCMADAGQINIREGITPLYSGSAYTYVPTQYYEEASYAFVPIRKNLKCDWPYAVRRYNGSGVNSYHYQAIVLKNVLAL